jgi:CRISPR/Cas system-associated exonuclease Cas4 (RecB family)
MVVGSGEVLQPVMYALAVEAVMRRPVVASRLFFCTSVGGFTERPVPIDDRARRAAMDVLETIDRAIASGFLPPAPRDNACQWCDFHEVCGPLEQTRAREVPKDGRLLTELLQLRSMP